MIVKAININGETLEENCFMYQRTLYLAVTVEIDRFLPVRLYEDQSQDHSEKETIGIDEEIKICDFMDQDRQEGGKKTEKYRLSAILIFSDLPVGNDHQEN